MTSFDRHLQAAAGYLELGMPLDAQDELDQIPSESAADWRVCALRVGLYSALERWEPMEAAAARLCRERPDEAQWSISLAYATRRARSLAQALAVLTEAAQRFPAEPIIHYNLACYEARLGNLAGARERLAEAMRLEPACRGMALTDPDLEALRDELR